MRNAFTAIIVILCVTLSCNEKNKTIDVLAQIDSLVANNETDSAYQRITNMAHDALDTDEERAYYNLLLTKIIFTSDKTSSNDSLIDMSIKHYKSTGNNAKLAEAYYYKGGCLVNRRNLADGLMLMKMAESTAKKVGDTQLLIMAYTNMAYINATLGTPLTGLEYARKGLAEAERAHNMDWKCMALNNIAMCHYYRKDLDSALIYMQKIEPYINTVSEDERAPFINNIGYLYSETGHYGKAEPLLRTAVSLLPCAVTYTSLAKNCYRQGKDREADSLMRLAEPDADFETKAEMYQFLAERAERRGDFKTSSRLYRQAKTMKDSMEAQRPTEETVTMQREYEHKEYARGVKSKETAGIVIAVRAVAVLAGTGVSFHRKTLNRAKRTIAEADRKIKEYTERTTALERLDNSHARKAKELERKIRRLKDEQAAVINSGKALYDGIMAGGTTATWKKNDFDEFIEYYRTRRPEAVAEAEEGYSRLSSTHIFYLMLADMGVAGDDMRRILCLTDGALRTMRSRIKSRKKSAS